MILCQHCKATPVTVEVDKESKVYQKKERLYLCDVCEILDRYDGINWTWCTTTPYTQQQDHNKTCTYNVVHTPTDNNRPLHTITKDEGRQVREQTKNGLFWIK